MTDLAISSDVSIPTRVFGGVVIVIGALSNSSAAYFDNEEETSRYSAVPSKFQEVFIPASDHLEGFSSVQSSPFPETSKSSALIATDDEGTSVNLTPASLHTLESQRPIDPVLLEIRGFGDLVDGWDGEGSLSPDRDAVKDALSVASMWPGTLPLPIADVDVSGSVVLDVIDKNGFSIGGFEFSGTDHSAVISVVSGSKVLVSSELNASNPSEIRKFFNSFYEVLA